VVTDTARCQPEGDVGSAETADQLSSHSIARPRPAAGSIGVPTTLT